MLPQPQRAKMQAALAGKEPSCSLLTVYIGFNTDLAALGSRHYSTFFGPEDGKTLSHFAETNHGDYKDRQCVFVDYGRIDAGLAPRGKSFGCLCVVDSLAPWASLDEQAYREKKEQVAQTLFDRLEAFLPGVKQTIASYEVGTPRTVQRYTANPGGAVYGFAQTPSQAGNRRLGQKAPVPGLWFASAWSFPGGGFSGAIIGGFLCAQELLQKVKAQKGDGPTAPVALEDSRSVALIARREIAEGTFELAFEKPPGFAPKAGQYAFVTLDAPQHRALDIPVRPLSIVSLAEEEEVRFAMRVSDSAYKQSCLAMQPGETATLYGPTGDFVLGEQDRPLVFLASGIGITPVMPMITRLAQEGFPQPVSLFYTDRGRARMAYRDVFEAIASPHFSLHSINTAQEARLGEALLSAKLGDLRDYHYYIVGTRHFLTSMQAILQAHKVPACQVCVDDFG